jgi:response regulator RpfG family c-di-GMP phosphodiesterase
VHIRTRIILTVLPLLLCAIVVTGTITILAATGGMMRLTMSLMAFKSEELSKYMYSQWELLVGNRLADRPDFVSAAQRAAASYAGTLVRSPSEMIFAVDSRGAVAMSTAPLQILEEEKEPLLRLLARGKKGWVDVRAGGVSRVGEAARFEPFGWYVFTTDEKSAFNREIRSIAVIGVLILIGAVLAAILLFVLFSHLLTRPINRMLRSIEEIMRNRDFSRAVEVMYEDEIGELAGKFNLMTGSLHRTYNQVKEHAYREALARKQVVHREYETLFVLARAAEYKDPETGAHISRVGYYSRMLARSIGANPQVQTLIFYASPMHDIGKLGIPDSILLKPQSLTAEEFEIIKTHTTIAGEILKDTRSPYLKAGAAIALTHHERFDGTGYPRGFKGKEIPLFGRIIGLVDTFDALTSRRPYKEAWELERAFEQLERERGAHFDPYLVEIFLQNADEVRSIYLAHREERIDAPSG